LTKDILFSLQENPWFSKQNLGPGFVLVVKRHHEQGDDTYNRLHDISKIISQRNSDSPFFCVGSTDFVDPRKDKWTSSSLQTL
jgi:hypothetical protein